MEFIQLPGQPLVIALAKLLVSLSLNQSAAILIRVSEQIKVAHGMGLVSAKVGGCLGWN